MYQQLVDLVKDAVDSPHTKRLYESALVEFLIWHTHAGRPPLVKATVQRYKAHLQTLELSASTINVKLAAIRKFVTEAADNGLLDQAHANGIKAIPGAPLSGIRTGNWLDRVQAQSLLQAPDLETLKGLRDTTVLSVLLGAALRRDEAARLQVDHLQQRRGTWGLIDLVGKRGKIRTVPIPNWVYDVILTWLTRAGIEDGYIFRAMRKGDRLDLTRNDGHMTGQAIWGVVKLYASQIGAEIAPHDLRRTAAKLMLEGGAPLEQISTILGHADLKTTQHYLGIELDWDNPATQHTGLSSPLK
jgi:site-specific recombinase XerD